MNPDAAGRRRQRTLRALADGDAGNLIADEVMQAWADSLGCRLIIGDHGLRYEIRTDTILVLNLWHTREDR